MANEAITILTSIDTTLKTLLATLLPLLPKETAPESDLDGPYGDPVIRAKDPRDWTGAPMAGRKFSECPPAYLELVADRLDFFARRAEETGELTAGGKPVAPYNRRDAARARGWAKRLREGWKAPALPAGVQAGTLPLPAGIEDDDIPF